MIIDNATDNRAPTLGGGAKFVDEGAGPVMRAGDGEGEGAAEEEGAVPLPPLTKMSTFWPTWQWPGKPQM